jgi:hypothetical protein
MQCIGRRGEGASIETATWGGCCPQAHEQALSPECAETCIRSRSAVQVGREMRVGDCLPNGAWLLLHLPRRAHRLSHYVRPPDLGRRAQRANILHRFLKRALRTASPAIISLTSSVAGHAATYRLIPEAIATSRSCSKLILPGALRGCELTVVSL